MRCIIFMGENALKTVDAYNTWAKDKPLGKDVIVHSHIVQNIGMFPDTLIIVVFFDENIHQSWVGKTE